VSNSEIDVTVKPGFGSAEVRQQISAILEKVPAITTNIGQPIEHRLSHILSGTPAAIAISIYGDDLAKLRVIAKEIEGALKPLEGARDVAANREVMIQSLPIDYRPADLASYGLTPRSAAEQVRNAVFGVVVAEINEGVRRYSLAVRLEEDERDTLKDIRNLILRGKGGALVRLHEVADIGPEMTSNLIGRENAQRRAVVTLNVEEGYNLGDLVEKVRERVDPIVQRFGYTVKYGGQFEAQQAASRTIFLFSGLVILIIYLSESPGLVSNTAALFGLGGRYVAPVISIASMVGFITLFGIAVRNGILLVNHYDHLMKHEGKTMFEAIVQGSSERLVPILMTALTAALAVVPIVLQGDQPGNEILAPLSVVILGGLLSSTFLNLIIVPAGYAAIHRVSAEQPNPKTKPKNKK
jgi:Cu/Ag efflux pump CusA